MTDFEVFSTDIKLRVRDVDAMGHVNNAVYFTYFETGRFQFFYSEARKEKFTGFAFILAHVSCDFIRPVTLDDRLKLQMWIKAIGSKSFKFHYQLVDAADRLYFPGPRESEGADPPNQGNGGDPSARAYDGDFSGGHLLSQ